MKKIKLNAAAEAVAKANGGMISTELLGVLREAHAAGLNTEDVCAFEMIPAEQKHITYGCPLSEEAEAVLQIRGRMGDREAKQVFFAAYEGLVRKRAAAFYYRGNGRRLLGDFDEAVSLACEAFYQAMDEADVVKDGRLVRVSNLFGVVARRYETKERMGSLSITIPANLYHAANRLDAYLKDNMLCLEDAGRETCEDAGCCGGFGWKSVRDACAALRMGSQPFSDLQGADVDAVSGGMCGDKVLFWCDGQNMIAWDTVRWIEGVIMKLSGSRKVRVFADFHGFNRSGAGMSFVELAEKYGCSTRTIRDDIKAAREMIAGEMRRQDAEVTAELAGGRRMGYLKSQAQ
ncbi:MAG: HTH domain-containing protein [Lachnospiraceae bacterium]|nr:HTH domain-containing protein [Lachnospiraceae bacterium]